MSRQSLQVLGVVGAVAIGLVLTLGGPLGDLGEWPRFLIFLGVVLTAAFFIFRERED